MKAAIQKGLDGTAGNVDFLKKDSPEYASFICPGVHFDLVFKMGVQNERGTVVP